MDWLVNPVELTIYRGLRKKNVLIIFNFCIFDT